MNMFNDTPFSRWMSRETQSIGRSIATQKTLAELCTALRGGEKAVSKTRNGDTYYFNNAALEKIAAAVPEDAHTMLKLPIFIFFDSQVAGSCYLSDEQALSLLIALGELSAQYEFKNGKVWLSRPLAVAIAAAYPGAFQFIIH